MRGELNRVGLMGMKKVFGNYSVLVFCSRFVLVTIEFELFLMLFAVN